MTRQREASKEMTKTRGRECSLVLAGAVGQGAFEAGVLRYLTECGYQPKAIMGTSSGALNALGLAHGVLRGESAKAAADLADAWVEEASLAKLFANSLSVADIVGRRGLLNQRGLYALMRAWAPPLVEVDAVASLRLSTVVAPLRGKPTIVRGTPHRSFEHVEHFSAADFVRGRIERMYTFVAASAAFPGLFAPVHVPSLGSCVDGGAVNNAPISIAEEGDGPVFLVSAFPADGPPEECPRGFALIMQLVDVLIQERLVRDLARLSSVRHVVEIRPKTRLPGNGISALFSRDERQHAVTEGYARAREVVGELQTRSSLRACASSS